MRHDYQFNKAVGENGLTVFVCDAIQENSV